MFSPAVFPAILFVVAFALRIWANTAFFTREAVWDGHYYDAGAQRIAEGFGYSESILVHGQAVSHPLCHYPVGYSAVLGAFYWLFGISPYVPAVLNSAIGAALALVTYGLARVSLSGARANVAGLLVAIHPGLVLYSALRMTEPLAALLTLLAFWIAVRDSHRLRGFVLGSLALGVAALVRPQALLCAPFFGWILIRDRWSSFRVFGRWIGYGALASVLAVMTVLPWTLRNCRVMDGCALISTNGGWNLAIGAFPRATGRFETLRASDGCRDVTGQVQQDRCWFAFGLSAIREQPGHWLGLIPAKLGFTFDHESFAVEYLHEARPTIWPEERRAFARDGLTSVHRLLVFAAAFSAVAIRVRGRGARYQGVWLAIVLLTAYFGLSADEPHVWPLVLLMLAIPVFRFPGSPEIPVGLQLALAFVATTVITHAVFFGEDRYHIVVTPVFALLAAAACRASAPNASKTKRERSERSR